MSKTKRKSTQHISVTIDLLRTFPDLNITKEADLHVALYRVGFDAQRDDDGNVTGLKPFTMLTNKLVRCANEPYKVRSTVIFVGNMRHDFQGAAIYRNIDILDVGVYTGLDTQLAGDLPYDLPVTEKVNTRKYTKSGDKVEFVSIDFDKTDTDRLDGIFGQGDE